MKNEIENPGLTTIVDQDLFKVTRHVGPYDVVCYTINGGETAGRITLSEKTFLLLVDELVKIRVDAAGLPADPPATSTKFAYIITRDFVADPGETETMIGYGRRGNTEFFHKLPASAALEIAKSFPFRFRILDDDGIVYYIGRSTRDDSFAPLDEVGRGAGAVSIEYRAATLPKGSPWEVL